MTNTLQALVTRLEEAFRDIARERMTGVPILNPALRVEAVGFQAVGSEAVGVLITPWFMNLILLPADVDTTRYPAGQELIRDLPSGGYPFLAAEEAGIGPYLSCSLFSPMSEFPDQEQAVAVARAVIEAVLTPATAHPDTGRSVGSPTTGERVLSRRQLLRGMLPSGGT